MRGIIEFFFLEKSQLAIGMMGYRQMRFTRSLRKFFRETVSYSFFVFSFLQFSQKLVHYLGAFLVVRF